MKLRHHGTTTGLLLAAVCIWAASVAAQDAAPRIPDTKIAALEAEFVRREEGTPSVRRRRACKSIIRKGEALVQAFPDSPNRYRVLGLVLQTRKELFSLEKSGRNREAIFETCRQLAAAPDEYASLRLDADLLLSERELARKGATPEGRAEALRALVARYRDTPAEARSLQVASLMALKLGNSGLLEDVRRVMTRRFAGDPELIEFQRTRLDSRLLGAPFHGTYTRVDGTVLSFPMDRMGESSVLYFWSKEERDLETRLAEWKALQDAYPDLVEIFSFNLDNLPDAGEKMLRTWGLDWTAMRLPGGRDSQTYRAYARKDPIGVHVSPTGYAALLPYKVAKGGVRAARSYLQKNPRYLSQLQSLFTGEFLILDPCGPFDAASPPELKTVSLDDSGKEPSARLDRKAASVPEEKLRAIQACFIAPPVRYRLPRDEARANYEKADALCRAAIERYPQAPDLWLVYNRRIVALLGLWKLASEPKYLERAVQVAHASLAMKLLPGAQVVPRFCLAKQALRRDDAEPESVLRDFLEAAGGDRASASALAAAAILALDACAPNLHARFRRTLLEEHADSPMAWTVVSFLLDRFHRYYLFRAPHFYGHISSRRRDRYLFSAGPEDASRFLKADLKALDGSTFSIPRDTAGKLAIILFAPPWEEGAAFPHGRLLKYTSDYAKSRLLEDINVIVAVLADGTKQVGALLKERPLDCRTLLVPGGIRNPLVHRLGILSEDVRPNVVLLRPDGGIAAALSGLLLGGRGVEGAIRHLIACHDEEAVDKALKGGNLEEVKRLAFGNAPLGVDRKKISPIHLRSRAKVSMALKNWEAALADIDEAILRQKTSDGRAAIKSRAAAEAMHLKARILEGLGQPERARNARQTAEAWEKMVTDGY